MAKLQINEIKIFLIKALEENQTENQKNSQNYDLFS